jgi:hypothetical protein
LYIGQNAATGPAVTKTEKLLGRSNMPEPQATPLAIAIDEATRVSGLLVAPPRASACYVFAHGAGAGMAHPFMAAVASGLAERGIATLRYQFPYMEQRAKRPDPPKLVV